MKELKVRKMFDRHVHLRWGDLMKLVALFTFRQCSGAIIMPNLKEIINTIEKAKKYEKQINILSHEKEIKFDPCMTYYLTDNTDIGELEEGFNECIWDLAKLYPAGATTNANNWVTDIKNLYPVFDKMQDIGMPLSLHGEEVDNNLSLYDRERVFVDKTLPLLLYHFPALKIIMEHVSTKEAVDFVIENENICATVTAHHLVKDKTVHKDYEGEFDPFYFCYPVLNSPEDRFAIRKAVTSDNEYIRKNFGAGTDSAPHLIKDKLEGKGGLFTAPIATELYAQVFIEEGAKLGHLNDFLAVNLLEGVYDISPVEEYMTLVKEEWIVPEEYNGIRPFMAGEKLQWKIKS